MNSPLEHIDIETIKMIALKAGDAIMQVYQHDFDVTYKDDQSPLTVADHASNKIICEALSQLFSTIPIISEENEQTPYEIRKKWPHYWCIDPLDGTKEFIKKNGEFTVNIALINNNEPVLGVVYAPCLGEIYYAKKGDGAYRAKVNDKCVCVNEKKLPMFQNARLKPQDSITIVASKSHLSKETQDFINNLTFNIQHSTLISKGSSLKLCMVATGEADVYPRLAPTMEWDTAAADAIVRESGKMTYQHAPTLNTPLLYNKPDLLNPWFVVC